MTKLLPADKLSLTMSPYVIDEPERMTFRVNRRTLVDKAVLEQERQRIFDTCWIYLGHESELRAPGDFRTRTICGRPLLFCKGTDGSVRAFLNACMHRAATVCPVADGEHDFERLSRVLQQIKIRLEDHAGMEKDDIVILAQPDTDYQTIVSTMDTVRSFEAVVAASVVDAALFPNISLGDAPVNDPLQGQSPCPGGDT